MYKRKFQEIIIENFEEIQRNFRAGLSNKGYSYDEDLLNDAFISCCNALSDKELTKKEVIKYFWTAYVNKYKTKMSKNKNYLSFEDMVDEIDDIDETYDDSADKIYKIIIEAIQDKFGIRDAYIWELYVCRGKSAKEIRNMGLHADNFVYLTRKIKRYILNHLIPENKELQELIKYRKEL